ncbi:MAG TPA: enoyl-CoA hydratase [Ktedonobacter sp.]|jgi:3-hydroxybutyryl-CoA dehydratase|nr:enoyl-CoA hydratase [Ktedonobacter sp.]HAG98590.1 enoyl-CoA hydratase [Ktedonobacter sp.]HBE24964.1 enoyl-CoA hydratase [Ktedonobacter sp.]HBE28787.1 enoyl-CoA hydratase [Ktedonobacter sp.]HCF86303.1 enoyl-CoA hydratase [Ktedonobacter sp.]
MSDYTGNPALLPPVGTRATRVRIVTEADVVRFAEVSGDHNPVHLDADYAASSPFGKRIVHGLLTGAFISAVLGNDLPGPGSIYLGQTLKFLAPVHLGDTVTVSVEVTAIREEKRLVMLRTDCTNQQGKLVLTGEATIKCV